MEPVPETERMEEFRPFSLPSLRVQSPAPEDQQGIKPPALRRSTEPSSTSPILPSTPSWGSGSPPLQHRPRAASPLPGHMRSRSATGSFAPPMARTQSMPGVNGLGHFLYSPQLRSQSPSGSPSPSRMRLPRKLADEAFPSSPTRVSVHDHLVTERNSSATPGLSNLSVGTRLRRPSSPLRPLTQHHSGPASCLGFPGTPSSVASAPWFRSSHESLSTSYMLANSYPSSGSVSSTPTSTRSRSPSISSLETIPDSPDAEEAALEAERIAQLKVAVEESRGSGGDGKNKHALDMVSRGRTLSFGSRDKRKRWSVCGAERRQDFDLETIWED